MLRARVLELGRPLVLDGGMATTLEQMGCNVSSALWSGLVLHEHPEIVEAVHSKFVDHSGVDIVSTCTYQATYEGYKRILPNMDDEKITALFQRSVRIARKEKVLVAASMGPYGAYLANGSEYRGDYDIGEEGFKEFHRRRCNVLWEAGPDFLLFETIPNLAETRALLSLLKEGAAKAVISFQCQSATCLASGEPLEEAVSLLCDSQQIIGVGVNCLAAELVLPLFLRVKHLLGTHQVFVAYPNGGGVWDAQEKIWHLPSAKQLMDALLNHVDSWIEHGIGVIGGCCQLDPEAMRMVANRVKKRDLY